MVGHRCYEGENVGNGATLRSGKAVQSRRETGESNTRMVYKAIWKHYLIGIFMYVRMHICMYFLRQGLTI